MPFNERGEWIDPNTIKQPNPYEFYRTKILKAWESPKGMGPLWNDAYRRNLHIEAATYLINLHQQPLNRENLEKWMRTITLELESERQCNEDNGFVNERLLLPHSITSCYTFYKGEGD